MRDHRWCDLIGACASVIRHANHVRHRNAKSRLTDDQIENGPRHPLAVQNGDDQMNWTDGPFAGARMTRIADQMNWTDGPFEDVLVNCRLRTLNWGQAFVVDASYWEDSQNLP